LSRLIFNQNWSSVIHLRGHHAPLGAHHVWRPVGIRITLHPDGRILPGGMSNLHGAPYGHLKALRCCFSTSSARRTRFRIHLQLKNSIHHSSKRVPANQTKTKLTHQDVIWDGTPYS